ncbi:putative ribonuclease H-like domain-containing protein [Tanacetum coccineum]
MFDSHESDRDDNLVNDRFKKVDGYHAVPPPYTGNYMPSRPDLSFAGLDEYVFQSAVRKTTTSVPETETSISKTSKDIVEKPKIVRPSAPIIEEWDTDSDNDSVFRPKSNQTKPKFTKINFVKSVATKLGQVPVNAVKQSSPRVATSISTARPVNIVAPKPKVNDALPTLLLFLMHNHMLLREMGKMLLSPQHAGFRDQQEMLLTITPKDSGSYMLKRFDYADLQGRLNGCTGHMTRNRSFLTDYQEIDGGFVAFGGSPKGGRKPALSFMRPFGCPVTILNTIDHLGSSCDNLSGSVPVNAATLPNADLPTNHLMPDLKDTGIFSGAYDDEEWGVFHEADLNNLKTTMNVSPIPTTRIYKDHPKNQIIRDINSATQTRRMTKISEEYAMEPKKVIQTLDDPSWIEAMQEELLQFKLQKVWTLVDLPNGKRAIGTKWVFRNKKDERGIVVRNKARLVAQGYTQEKCIDYDELLRECSSNKRRFPIFNPSHPFQTASQSLILALDFLPRIITQSLALGLPTWQSLSTTYWQIDLEEGIIDKLLFIKKDKDDAQEIPDEFYGGAHFLLRVAGRERRWIFISKIKAEDVDVHLYRLMIGSLMYLTTSRPDIMFAVCACVRFQVILSLTFSCSEEQCKKQTIVANSTTEAEYVAAANCYGQVLWIQNQMLDYGFNFMNTKIYIDNESTICIVKNPVFHSKTKHIKIGTFSSEDSL